MDFSLNEEQAIFRDSVDRYLREAYSFEIRQKLVAEGEGFTEEQWRTFAELGLLALPFPEDYGGLGGSAVETMVLMEQFGRHLVVSPYLSTVLLGGQLILEAGTEAQKSELLPAVAAGELKLAVAYAEPQSRFDLTDVETTATPDGDGYRLDGRKSVVFYGSVADRLIVLARTSGATRDADGLGLFLVDPATAGLIARHYRTQDGARASDLRLESVQVGAEDVLGMTPEATTGAAAALERVADQACTALAAEAVGAMWSVYEQTLEYAKTRTQFGQTLGAFQSLQHRLVDLYMSCQLAQSMAYEATASLGPDDSANDTARAATARSVAAAKHKVGACGRLVGQEGVQIHGGIGMTMDLPIGHYLKRLTMINATLGDPGHQLRRYAALSYEEAQGGLDHLEGGGR